MNIPYQENALAPKVSLLIKLASFVMHTETLLKSPLGHDRVAVEVLLADKEIGAWMLRMSQLEYISTDKALSRRKFQLLATDETGEDQGTYREVMVRSKLPDDLIASVELLSTCLEEFPISEGFRNHRVKDIDSGVESTIMGKLPPPLAAAPPPLSLE